jgi:hypothetical protein
MTWMPRFRVIHFERKGMPLCAGPTTAPAARIFLNVGDIIQLIPLTGVTLPFDPPLTVPNHGCTNLIALHCALHQFGCQCPHLTALYRVFI